MNNDLHTTPPDPSPATPRPAWRRAARGLGWGLAVLAAGCAALLGWVWHADSGTAWLLRQLPMLTLQAPQGALGSGQFRTERLQLDLAAGQLVIEQVEIKGLDWTLRPHGGAWLGLSMQSLTGQTLRWQSHPSTTPSTPLESLELPVQVQIEAVQIARLTVDELPPLEGLDASLSLGNPAGSPHRIQLRALRSDRLAATGQLQLGAAAPMPVQAEFKLDSLNTEPAWNAKLRLDGPLARMAAVATLRGAALPGQAAPQADLDTVLQPFAPWPLGDLRLSAEALNLASLNSDWPETRLQIKAQLKSAGLDQPAQAELSLGNALAGRWDQQRLPIRSLSAQIGGTPEPLTELTLKQLAIDWGSAQATAGQWRGQGRYLFGKAQGSAELALTLSQWQPAALDMRMPGLLMGGPVKLSATALPAPGAATAGLPELSVAAKLTGRLLSQQGPQGSMTLNLDGQGTARKITLREADLRAEGSRLQATGTAEHQADGRWHWKAQGQVAELDLRSWWPGPADSEWQRQSQRLNASFSSQASVPASALQDPAKVLAQLRGELALQISQSAWAGVPLEGSARWSADDRTQQADARLLAADSQFTAHWQAANGQSGSAQARLQSPRLEALAPWVRLMPAVAPWAPAAGSLDLQVQLNQASGSEHWLWKTEALLKKLQAADLRLDEARLNASGGNLAADPLAGKLSLRKLRQGDAKLNNLDLSLDGSLQAHRFSLQADSPLTPPAWLERLAGSNHRSGAKARVQGSGQWLRQAQGQVWTGTLAELDLRNGDGSGEPWLSASALGAALRWNTEGTLSQAELSPGSLRTPVTSLSWTLARFDNATSTRQASSQLDAEFASTAMAPLLARLQPEAAWTGDLRMGGHIKLRHAGQLDADLVLERLGGDLNLDEDGLQSTMRATPLGLTDLRLGLRAINGQWQFTQGMAGTYLGSLASAITVTADPKRYWPRPGATLQGTAQLNVANLGAWASWIPAGWRLGGQIESGMQFSGTWGAPEVSGRLSGQRLSVRNALQGVALTEGELQLALDGSHAHLEKFRFKGGDGSLSVVGDAQLGARPQAKLNIEARRFRALGRIDRQLTVSGDAVMQLDPETLSLTGKLGADEGLIDISRGNGPSLSDDVVVIAPTKASPEVEQAHGSSRRVATLALDVDLGQKLRLRGHGIDTGLRGSLKLSNPRGKLSAQGSVRTEGGNFAAYGQKLSIERGVILFTGPVNDPRLDIYAIRPNLDVKVGVTITGTALNPRVRLASDTDMTDTDKLSWLVMGRAPEGLGQADTAMLQRAALALLMGEGGNPTDGLMESIGLSDFSLRQAADSNNVQTTVVTVGKQLTRRWYVGYERSVNATAGTWQLIYRIAQRFTLRAQSGEDSALDAIWTWRWD